MKYHALFVIFEKKSKIFNFGLLDIIGGALRVKKKKKALKMTGHFRAFLFIIFIPQP